jgi:hypothetical protein
MSNVQRGVQTTLSNAWQPGPWPAACCRLSRQPESTQRKTQAAAAGEALDNISERHLHTAMQKEL